LGQAAFGGACVPRLGVFRYGRAIQMAVLGMALTLSAIGALAFAVIVVSLV
jgi:hypothetical protein